MNNVALSVALATAPSSAFAELRERPRFWFPLLLVVICTAGMAWWYYSIVDIDWLKDVMFSNNPGLQPEQRAAAMGMVTRTTLLWGSVVGTVIAVPVFFLLQALLLLLAAKITRVALGLKHWFALACWSSLPALIGLVVAAILLILSDTTQIAPGVLQPLSINELLVHRPMGSPGQGFLDAVGIPGLLAWALMIIGVHTWSQRSWLFSAAFVMIPIVVIYGIWAFFAFR
ncbi:MAG TPA: YIP1 family protein [Steroidobacteraceae bacterium]|nr:YIP1 family protein [Steroidobacteraceae bacterium]